MQMEFKQSESIAERRRWILVLVDSADGVTGKTGQTGTVEISKNGGTPTASTNSIVEVDSVNMPGHYYIELTAAELDTLGMVSIYYKAANTLAFHDRGFVTYNNPYQSVGGFAAAPNASGGIKKEQADALIKDVRKVVKEEIAKIKMPKMPEIKMPKMPEMPEMPDYSKEMKTMMDCMDGMEAHMAEMKTMMSGMEKKDEKMMKMFGEMNSKMSELRMSLEKEVGGFVESSMAFQGKMQIATKEIDGSVAEVAKIKEGFSELQKLMDQFKTTLAEQSDMDKRFDAMSQAKNNKQIEQLSEQIKKQMIEIINMKFDILKALPMPELKKVRR